MITQQTGKIKHTVKAIRGNNKNHDNIMFNLSGFSTTIILCLVSFRLKSETEENQGMECNVFTEGTNGTGKLFFSSLLPSTLFFSLTVRISPNLNADTKCTGFCKITKKKNN